MFNKNFLVMKVSVSTIKKEKVFLIICMEQGVSKDDFSQAVQYYFLEHYPGVPYSFYADTYDDTLAMIVIPDVNQDHEDDQQILEI